MDVPQNTGDAMVDRVLMFLRGGQYFAGLARHKGERTQALLDAAQTLSEAFDLSTAEGAQLDALGSILQRPRGSYADERYRTLLYIQVELLLAGAATAETILSVVEQLTGAPAPEYVENYPAGFRVTASVPLEDIALLLELLRGARAASFRGDLAVVEPGAVALLGDVSVADGGPVASVGLLDVPAADGGPVVGAQTTVPHFSI